MRSSVLVALMVCGCSETVAELGVSPEEDLGVNPVDEADLAVGRPDRGTSMQPDVAGRVDVGPDAIVAVELPCPEGWTTLTSISGDRGVEPRSLAYVEGSFALTFDTVDDAGNRVTHLQVFDATGGSVSPLRAVGERSSVVAVDGRFLLGGRDGVRWLEPDGSPGATRFVGPFLPQAVVGDFVHGRILADASDSQPATLNPDSSVDVHGVPLPLGSSPVVFGPYTFVVAEDRQVGAQLRLYEITEDGAMPVMDRVLPAEQSGGESWIPTTLGGGVWNPGEQRFELVFGVTASNGRFLGVRVFHLDPEDETLVPADPLPGQLSRVTHQWLDAAMAHHDGVTLLAYVDIATELDPFLRVVAEGSERRFEMGNRHSPLLTGVEGGFAMVAAFNEPANAFSPNQELRLRCDLL